mmetsp:Transcript_81031/g.251445  ORF Transcript_81031/g.251445 Transcript_81031/m.251445 type:complete len:223 (-) Transcript_81031:161-829(-)
MLRELGICHSGTTSRQQRLASRVHASPAQGVLICKRGRASRVKAAPRYGAPVASSNACNASIARERSLDRSRNAPSFAKAGSRMRPLKSASRPAAPSSALPGPGIRAAAAFAKSVQLAPSPGPTTRRKHRRAGGRKRRNSPVCPSVARPQATLAISWAVRSSTSRKARSVAARQAPSCCLSPNTAKDHTMFPTPCPSNSSILRRTSPAMASIISSLSRPSLA